MTRELLRRVGLFSGLSEADLRGLEQSSEELRLEAGAELFKEGEAGDRAYVLLDGELEILKSSGGRPVLLALRSDPGDLIGEMALLEQEPRMATVRARVPSRLLGISQLQFDALLASSPRAARAVFRTVVRRWRETEAMLHQSEKMAQLGTLTAGVAHELNNPAAAALRSTAQIREELGAFVGATLELPPSVRGASLERLLERAAASAEHPPILDTLGRADRESALEAWIESRGLERGVEAVGALVGMGYDPAELERLYAELPPGALEGVLAWLASAHSLHVLIRESAEAAKRMAHIVKALRSYSFLDQAPLQSVDIHEGLENTVLILGHKLGGIEVRREYGELPRIEAYGNELNQVWTNIIDNAADALEGSGRITIRTRRESGTVAVEIEDNGRGIASEAQGRIFEAFFTTKPQGRGTGLGLHISYNIVVARHRGDIRYETEPGRTCFRVLLPIRVGEAPGTAAAPAPAPR